MEVAVQIQRLFHVQIQRLLLTIATVVAVVVVFQFLVSPNKNYISNLWDASNGSVVTVGNVTSSSSSKLTGISIIHGIVNNSMASDSEGEGKHGDETQVEGMEKDSYFQVDGHEEMNNSFQIDEDGQLSQEITSESGFDHDKSLRYVKARNINTSFSMLGEVHSESSIESLGLVSPKISPNVIADLDAGLRTPPSSIAGNASSAHNNTELVEIQPGHTNKELLGNTSTSQSNHSSVSVNLIMKGRRRRKPTTISDMTLLLLQNLNSSSRPQRSSPRDRELQYARSQIQNAPVIRSSPELYASLFRNYSMFRRSYELMERMLKVYIYKEGEKPIFHQPRLTGIYASEGWFMQLIERNKQFVVRDPRKAHLFYLPFSSKNLRIALQQKQFTRREDLEEYLKNYTDIIARKYRFLNRVKGADHFLVACHDWAPWMTRKSMGNFIRVLCNANVARDFRIGKDVSLPVTYIRSAQDPGQDLGGKPPSQRTILAFFAGNMHGYLRPVLLHHWENKEPDMKISGPMPRDREGKTKYMESMKSSKYCVCARGYEVHTPRVVEAIYHECVPVIISDNYEPPFFEVLDWEAFSVFVLEKDIPNLRNILLSIPEDRYLAMQQRVKLVQQHFLWHRKPAKYDLFHMILHSVWYNRVLQVKL